MPVVFGAGCYIDDLLVHSDVILHNSGLVAESAYSPAGIWMIGIAYDEEANPITLDSGMWTTGPRPVHGTLCKICRKEYNSKKPEAELHAIHLCEWPDCKYGGQWASCAPKGSLLAPSVHGPASWCPYGLCANCSDIRCAFCQRDLAAKAAQ
jgi:hypothetical protein